MGTKRFVDIRYWNQSARGGHFATFERPELFTDEVRSPLRLIRDRLVRPNGVRRRARE